MNHFGIYIVCGALLLGQAVQAGATPIIDQSQASAIIPISNFGSADLAQSFQQSNSNIAGAGIYVAPSNVASPTATISVWDDLPNASGAMMLATGSGLITPGGYFDVFWTPVAISPGVTYYLSFIATGAAYDLQGASGNPYPLGNAYANSPYVSHPTLDFAFRTYYEPVPEPMTWSLLVAGLVGLSATRIVRRRSNAVRSI